MVKPLSEAKKIAQATLDRLIDEAGSQAHLARMLGESPQLIARWVKQGQISKRGAVSVVRNAHLCDAFTLKQLRPDVLEEEWTELLEAE